MGISESHLVVDAPSRVLLPGSSSPHALTKGDCARECISVAVNKSCQESLDRVIATDIGVLLLL